MSPALNGSTALQRFERGKVVDICNRIMFDFYPGLPHIHIHVYLLLSRTYQFAYIPSKISLRIGQVWVAWEGHQEGLLSGGPWGDGVEQLVLVCEGEENKRTSERNVHSL